MSRTLRTTMMLTTALLLGACGKSEPAHNDATATPVAATTAATTGAVGTTAAATTTAAAAGTVAAASVPTPEDYEATAEKTVTADSLTAQLDALEKEIAATPR